MLEPEREQQQRDAGLVGLRPRGSITGTRGATAILIVQHSGPTTNPRWLRLILDRGVMDETDRKDNTPHTHFTHTCGKTRICCVIGTL